MSARRLFSGSVIVPALLGLGVFGLAAALSTRDVETHPRITTTLLWHKDIAPILQRRCFSCHSPNNVAFSLATFSEARPWAAAIREEVLTRHMPPWSAVAGYGRFQNDPSLTQGEWDLLVAWVDGGAPSGQTLAEEAQAPVFVSEMPMWEHGEPDLVLSAPAATAVPAGAGDEVKRIELQTPFKSAQRVHGLAFRPGERRVVRHAAVYEAGTNRWLFSWTPWATAMHLPEGVAYTLPAGAKLILEIGYHGAEEAASDTSEVGLYLDDAASGAAATTMAIEAAATDLPAGAGPTRIRAEAVLDAATGLQAVYPRLGAGARSLELTAHLPDGNVRPLLWLRDYRTDWPSPYVYTDPVPLPRGTRLVMTAYEANPGETAVKVRPSLSLVRVPSTATTF
ncbi:MAG: hypothetical protein IT177_01975 [Acidobacteria bacterium]|nr:hypothetical protein [Acidobacteriota bacterium]